MPEEKNKPIIGISIGDINGIGIEVIIKSFSDPRMLDICTPIVFGNNRAFNFYRKTMAQVPFSYTIAKDIANLNPKQVNIFNCWDEDFSITPGVLNEAGGKYAGPSLHRAVQALKENQMAALVTAPIHKKNIQSEAFSYSGHTPYLQAAFDAKDVLMLMVAENMKIGLVTEHLPIAQVAAHITKEGILSKMNILHKSLQTDFGIEKPKIAVLGLNPHAGDEGLIGNEEETIIKAAVNQAKQTMIVAGPFSADAFFARSHFLHFDCVLAMYHDQGLIPFKSLAIGEGVNFTAGLPIVRTSPDHGTAFDIAGKDKADPASFLAAVFRAVNIAEQREQYRSDRQNPLKRTVLKGGGGHRRD